MLIKKIFINLYVNKKIFINLYVNKINLCFL